MISTIAKQPKTTLLAEETTDQQGQRQLSMAANANASFANSTGSPQTKIIVRTEEVVIVTLVLVLWIAAIALFFNRWGKIRMLEPYQPKFIQQHRPSCPLVDQVQHRSFSKFNISGEACQAYHLRPRQNSVFVGSSIMTLPTNPPRKVKSAFDLQNLILSDPALNRSIVRLNLTRDDLRRSSLKTTLNVYADSHAEPSSARERRLSFKDLVEENVHSDRVQCSIERETTDGELNKRTKKIGEARQSKSISNQSSVSDSRHNSITCQDSKVTVQSKPDRRSSLMPTQRDADDHRSGVGNFRRNSAMFINSLDTDRNYLLPRSDNIKSGVIDFRRNSMMIINNLNEDIGIRSVGRNMSLGGSNVNLGGDFTSARRSSVIPPFCHEPHKPKMSIPHVSIVKTKPSFGAVKSPSVSQKNESKFLANQKASKSLDSTESTRTAWKNTKTSPDLSRQFLAPVTVQKHIGSTSSLNTDHKRLEDRKLSDESRSTGNLATDKAEFHNPRILETAAEDSKDASKTNLTKTEEGDDSKKSINLTTSLSNINITSAIPLNVITSSGMTKKTNQIDMSHCSLVLQHRVSDFYSRPGRIHNFPNHDRYMTFLIQLFQFPDEPKTVPDYEDFRILVTESQQPKPNGPDRVEELEKEIREVVDRLYYLTIRCNEASPSAD
ncbi:UNVERIFIED_CONTAM: hypothetical protein PYX00_010103 [Menopon gallinae]|uniref:Fibronectin type III domain-containing protein n=1 Tax=Menopon gallinae TaxID=328185 RepID=A0AAW2HEM9_9NEOP